MAMTNTRKCDPAPPVALHERAMDNLSFIRDAMARSAPLTAVSGRGAVLMGLIALVGAFIAAHAHTTDGWIYSWLAVACLGCVTGGGALILKARRTDSANWKTAARKFALSLFPPILAGVVLTEVLYERFLEKLMPGTWLLLYGVAIATGGRFSIRILPLMGFCFMALGTLALFIQDPFRLVMWDPFSAADLILAVGFGGFHILFGAIIARKHGG